MSTVCNFRDYQTARKAVERTCRCNHVAAPVEREAIDITMRAVRCGQKLRDAIRAGVDYAMRCARQDRGPGGEAA